MDDPNKRRDAARLGRPEGRGDSGWNEIDLVLPPPGRFLVVVDGEVRMGGKRPGMEPEIIELLETGSPVPVSRVSYWKPLPEPPSD